MGYLNNVKKVDNKYVRQPQVAFSNWENEKRVMNLLGYQVTLKPDGTLERDWIEGDTIKELTPLMAKSLVDEIERIHTLPTSDITSHDWHKYDAYLGKLTAAEQTLFKKLVNDFQDRDLVVSHNDLNFHNMLWNGHEIIPIDYEWANLNHPYFDYVQFYIAEGINLLEQYDKQVWNNLLILSLLYFLMWTFAAPQVEDVYQWREKYQNMLQLYMK